MVTSLRLRIGLTTASLGFLVVSSINIFVCLHARNPSIERSSRSLSISALSCEVFHHALTPWSFLVSMRSPDPRLLAVSRESYRFI